MDTLSARMDMYVVMQYSVCMHVRVRKRGEGEGEGEGGGGEEREREREREREGVYTCQNNIWANVWLGKRRPVT